MKFTEIIQSTNNYVDWKIKNLTSCPLKSTGIQALKITKLK